MNPESAPPPQPTAHGRLSAERMEALLDHSWDILSLLDGEGRLIYNSPAAQRLHGFSAEEMAGRNTFEFIHPDDGPPVGAAFERCLGQPGQPVFVQYRYARKGGAWMWMEAVAINLLDHPDVRAVVVNSRDISERVASRIALEDSERFADLVLDALGASIAVLDDQGRILKVNAAWRHFGETHGLPGGTEWSGVDYLSVCDHATGAGAEGSQRVGAGIRAMLEGDLESFTAEYPCQTPSALRWFQVRVTRFHGLGTRRLVVTHADITDLKRAEENRLQMERMLHRSQRMDSLGSLAGGVAHDMNNVLSAILGIASLHLESLPPGTELQRAFAIIAKSCDRGGALVRRLLDFSRQDLANPTVLSLNDLIRDDLQLLERTTLGRIQLEAVLADDLEPIHGDPSALSHAILNLCLNAIDAMPDGGLLRLQTRNLEGRRVALEVADSGAGMAPEVLARATDPFFTTKPMGKGTGLGLSIVYATVRAHHGRLDLESEVGRGTRAVLTFPAFSPSGHEAGAPAVHASQAVRPGLRILLVDDDELIRSTLGPMLLALGHEVQMVASGGAALAVLASGLPPDLVLLDMNMPGLSGRETLADLRGLHPDLPVLVITGRVDSSVEALVRSHPKVGLLPKPFSLETLRSRLEAWVLER